MSNSDYHCPECKVGGGAFEIRDHLFCSPECGNRYFNLEKGDEGYWDNESDEEEASELDTNSDAGSEEDDSDDEDEHGKLVNDIIKLANKWEGQIPNLASNKYSGCGLDAMTTEKLTILIKVMNQQISDNQHTKVVEEDDTINDDFDYENSCDCCVKGWTEPNEFGLCQCCCSNCDNLLSDCRYRCRVINPLPAITVNHKRYKYRIMGWLMDEDNILSPWHRYWILPGGKKLAVYDGTPMEDDIEEAIKTYKRALKRYDVVQLEQWEPTERRNNITTLKEWYKNQKVLDWWNNEETD